LLNKNDNIELIFIACALAAIAIFVLSHLMARRQIRRAEAAKSREQQGGILNAHILAGGLSLTQAAAALQISESRLRDYVLGRKMTPQSVIYAMQYVNTEQELSDEAQRALSQLWANPAEDSKPRPKLRLLQGGVNALQAKVQRSDDPWIGPAA
jgi:plasmid maintenance system antidote protein VapI